MTIAPEARQAITDLGKEAIETITTVAELAKQQLSSGTGTDVFAYAGNALTTGTNAGATLNRINVEETERLRRLHKEPVIARIVAITDDDTQEVFYISRAAPINLRDTRKHYASYGSPLGRLASIPVGDEITIKTPGRIKNYEILERTELHPRYEQEWDSCDNIIESQEHGLHTVSSFRIFFSEGLSQADVEDVLSSLLEQESGVATIVAGRRRSVIDRMQLRDQPILDQYQDHIFRLPLDCQILITGPPGTGKTTTLIRRLAQKLEQSFFTEEEKDLLTASMGINTLSHEQSWVMFSPTELLKLYVKESFNREGIPAPEERIRTWTDERRRLSRNVLGILRSGNGGVFTLDENLPSIQMTAVNDATIWFEDFQSYFQNDLLKRLVDAMTWLTGIEDSAVKGLVSKVEKSVGLSKLIEKPIDSAILFGVVVSLNHLSSDVESVVKLYNDELRELIKGWLNAILRNQRDFLNALAGYLETLKDDATEDNVEDEDEDEDSEDDSLVQASSTMLNNAQKGYIAAMRALAQSKLTNRQLRPATRAAKVVAWLSDRLPPEAELMKLGTKLAILSRLRRIANPIQLYVSRVPARYNSYRKECIKEDRWYISDDNTSSFIRRRALNGLEVDLIVLLMLQNAGKLITRLQPREIDSNAKYAILRSIQGEYRHQVLVDEATDFSPIQLSCMLELSHPKIRSFVACGDLHQRITSWGTRDFAYIKWVSERIEVRPMTVAYRQSRKLTNLAREIALLSQDTIDHVSLPDRIDNEGEAPVLAENLLGRDLASWLGSRVIEVEQRVGKLPSIAIFVDGEDAVDPLANDLGDVLKENNIQVVSCPRGRVMGQDGDIRVFDVQHIKGLEFEAVFFTGIDRLAERESELFNKFLYVGATRAATYLGLTCETILPTVMDGLRETFVSDWAS